MKKVLSLVLALAMVLGSFGFTFAAAPTATVNEAGEYLRDLGVLQGVNDQGDLNLEGSLKRQDMIVLLSRLLGVEDEAESFPLPTTFTDVPEGYYVPFVAWAQMEGLTEGMGNGLFGFNDQLTVRHLVTFLLRALGHEGEAAWNQAAEVAGEFTNAGLNTNATRGVMAQATLAALYMEMVDGEMTLGTFLGLEGFAPVVTDLAVESVKVINAKTIEVVFNKAVENTGEMTFEVKRGNSAVVVEANWADDKKSVELERSVNFLAGDYTVKIGEFEAVSLKIEAQKVTSIEFRGTDLVKNQEGTSATFRYVVRDQYGVDMTNSVPATAFTRNAIVGTSTIAQTNFTLTTNTGVGRINKTFADADTTAVITLVHNATGVSASATFTVAAAPKVESFTFGEIVFPTNKTRLEAGVANAATIPVTVLDQYGNKIEDLATLNAAMLLISSDSNVGLAFELDADDKPVIKVNTESLDLGVLTSKPLIITAVTAANGVTYTQNLTVHKQVAPHSIELGEFSREVLAVEDTIYVPITVADQFGELLSPAQVVSNASVIQGWISGNAKIGPVTVVTNRDSAHYGKLQFSPVETGIDVLVINAPAGLFTRQLEVKEKRVVNEVRNVAATTLLQGATHGVRFAFYDQYQEQIAYNSLTATRNNEDLKWTVELTRVSGDVDAITLTNVDLLDGGTDENLIREIEVAAATNKTGTYRLTVKLINVDTDVVVSSASTNLTAARNNVAGLTYSVKEIPVLAGDVNYTKDSVYAHKLVVEAKDAAGTNYVINPADIVNVTSNFANVARTGRTGLDWFVFGQSITGTENKTATLTISINTLDGIKTVTAPVTVSPQAPQVEEVRVLSSAIADEGAKTIAATNTNRSVFEFAGKAAATTGSAINVVGKDQYGVWNNLDADEVVVVTNSTNLAPVNAFRIIMVDGVATLQLNTENVTVNRDILVTISNGTGSRQITVRINQQ